MRGVWEQRGGFTRYEVNVRLEEIKSLPSLNFGGPVFFAVQKKKDGWMEKYWGGYGSAGDAYREYLSGTFLSTNGAMDWAADLGCVPWFDGTTEFSRILSISTPYIVFCKLRSRLREISTRLPG